MISVTGAAASYLADLLSNDAIEGDPVVRIRRSDSGLAMRLDVVRSGDEVVEHDGQPLVAVSGDLAPVLDDTVLDVREEGSRPRLVLTR